MDASITPAALRQSLRSSQDEVHTWNPAAYT
jgi:hypothetical protein